MKKIKLMIGIAALALAVVLPARAGIQNTTLNAGTNNVAANATNDVRAVGNFSFAQTTKANISISAACTGASTANYDFAFDTSIGDGTWQSNAFSIRLVGNGTNRVTTNYTVPDAYLAPLVRPATIANTNAATTGLTNIVISGFSRSGI